MIFVGRCGLFKNPSWSIQYFVGLYYYLLFCPWQRTGMILVQVYNVWLIVPLLRYLSLLVGVTPGHVEDDAGEREKEGAEPNGRARASTDLQLQTHASTAWSQ
jgi:hypothetical protein